jgi:hypothetical protein
LLKEKNVRIRDASQGCPPSATATSSFSCGKLPATGLRTEINMFGSRSTVGFIFFLDRTQIYKNNETSLMNFGQGMNLL